jgi:hypothetical protein
MLTWDDSSSSRPRGVSVNKVIIVPPIGRTDLVIPFCRESVLEAMKSLYKSFLFPCRLEPVYATVGCAYAWLLCWVMLDVENRKPISPEHKANKAGSLERPRHFFSAQKLNMRNAP